MKTALFIAFQVVAFGAILFPVVAAQGATPDRLTLEAATREALGNNPSIISAWRKWNAARTRVAQEKAWDDPRVSADFTPARFVDVPPNAFTDQTVALEEMIPISGKNLSRGRVAEAEALISFEEFRRQQLDVASKLRVAYFQLLNGRTQLAINDRTATALHQIAIATRAKFQAGTEMAPDVLSAEIESSKITEKQRDIERLQSEAQTRLNVLMNRPVSSSIGALSNESLPPPALSEKALMDILLSSRPEVRMAQARINAEKARLQLAHREWIPDPSINVNAQRYNEASQAVSQLGTGISFSIPWVNPGKHASAIHEAGENVEAATAELQSVKSESLGLLHDQLQRIETAHHHYELYSEKILPQAQQAFDSVQLNYETGKSGFTDWITAQRSLRDVEATVNEMFTEYQIAIAELEGMIGAELHSPSSKGK